MSAAEQIKEMILKTEQYHKLPLEEKCKIMEKFKMESYCTIGKDNETENEYEGNVWLLKSLDRAKDNLDSLKEPIKQGMLFKVFGQNFAEPGVLEKLVDDSKLMEELKTINDAIDRIKSLL